MKGASNKHIAREWGLLVRRTFSREELIYVWPLSFNLLVKCQTYEKGGYLTVYILDSLTETLHIFVHGQALSVLSTKQESL